MKPISLNVDEKLYSHKVAFAKLKRKILGLDKPDSIIKEMLDSSENDYRVTFDDLQRDEDEKTTIEFIENKISLIKSHIKKLEV